MKSPMKIVYFLYLFFVASLCIIACNGMSVIEPGVINTTYGPVEGKNVLLQTNKEVVQFLGIPYANASRFDPPEPPTSWHNDTRQTKTYGKSCPQAMNSAPHYLDSDSISEYCLNLNVFVPNTTEFRNESASYPVMVWVQGGAFIMGTSARQSDASLLATEGEIVVVSINYRLGALGFLSTGEDGLNGNFGMLDVIEALRWVQNNIESFGGNPYNVTIAGWSAGARLVSMVTLSNQAADLYHQVILMSGVADGLFSYLTQDEARNRAEYYGALLRCPFPSPDFVNCLKRKSIAEIVSAQAQTIPSTFLPQWAPVIDGRLIRDVPAKLVEDGRFNKTNILMGVASSDGTAFLSDVPGMNTGIDISKAMNRTVFVETVHQKIWLRRQDSKLPNMVVFQYTDWTNLNNNDTRKQYLDMLTDAVYRAPAIQTANGFVGQGMRVYFYQTEVRQDKDVSGKTYPSWWGVPHGEELRYLFPNPNVTSIISGQTKSFMDFWINFVKTGDPNQKGQQVWPIYTHRSGNYLALQDFPSPNTQLRSEEMHFWNEFLPANGVKEKEKPRPPEPDKSMDPVLIALIVISVLFGILLIVLIVLVIMIMRGGLRASDKYSRAPPPAPYSPNKSTKPLYSDERVSPPKYEDRSYAAYNDNAREKSSPRYPDNRTSPDYPGNGYHDNEKIQFKYPEVEKSTPLYAKSPDYPSYDERDASYYRGSSAADYPDKYMDSDML